MQQTGEAYWFGICSVIAHSLAFFERHHAPTWLSLNEYWIHRSKLCGQWQKAVFWLMWCVLYQVFVVFWLNLNRSCFVQFNLFSSCHCCNLVRKRVRYFGALVNQGKLLEVGDDRCSQKLYPWLLESPDKMLALLISLFAQRRTSFNSYLERVAWIIKILPRPRQKCRKIPPRNQI